MDRFLWTMAYSLYRIWISRIRVYCIQELFNQIVLIDFGKISQRDCLRKSLTETSLNDQRLKLFKMSQYLACSMANKLT